MENARGFDPNVTLGWVTRVLKDPQEAATAYRDTQPAWRTTFMQITLPVYAVSAIGGFILSWIFGGAYLFGATAGAPLYFLFGFAWSLALVFVVAFLFDYFAGTFEGQRSYDRAFAMVSLALIPAALGGMLSPLPWLGWLIGLVAAIYSLVLLYRFVPVFMGVPEPKRAVHFIVSLLAAFVVNLIVSMTLGATLGSAAYRSGALSDAPDAAPGMFGGLERQADIADQAARDRYDPPAHGQMSDAQVAEYARTLRRTAELRERLSSRFEEKDSDALSVGDLFSGVRDAMRISTAEMEVVKTAGGNWAEHQWVRNQLETARIQQDTTPAVEHNYALFLKYRDQIEPWE
jgi:hypothetical protein